MRFSAKIISSAVSLAFCLLPAAQAYWVWSPSEGKFVSSDESSPHQSAESIYLRAQELKEQGNIDEVIKQLKALVRDYPMSAYAPEAQFLMGKYLEQEGKHSKAAQAFQTLISDFPRSDRIDDALDQLFRIGNLFLGETKQEILGLKVVPVLPKAAEIFQFIVDHAPYGKYGNEAQYRLGLASRRMGRLQEAVQAFESVLQNYPDSTLVDEVNFQLAETSYDLAQVTGRDEALRDDASERLSVFLRRYQASPLIERAQALKRDLDEQDAEKNYQIGLYYEKKGFIESAVIYYEGISEQYPETQHGAKAQERLELLRAPADALVRDQHSIEKRLAEVDSMLKALAAEARSQEDEASRAEQDELRAQLAEEKTSLEQAQQKLVDDAQDRYQSRRKSHKERQRDLNAKIKTFRKRSKALSKGATPELIEVLEQWRLSLIKEQEELDKEAETLRAMRFELAGEEAERKWLAFGWLPFIGPAREPSEDALVHFEESKWAGLEERRQKLAQEQQVLEERVEALAAGLRTLDLTDLQSVQSDAHFQAYLPENLISQKAEVDGLAEQLSEARSDFEKLRTEYELQFGQEFVNTLAGAAEISGAVSIPELEEGESLEALFAKLETKKSVLSEKWLSQKEKVDTMSSVAAGEVPSEPIIQKKPPLEKRFVKKGEPAEETPPPALTEGEQKEARLLKKRIKYVEREIRRRVDQIDDWEEANVRRADELERLLYPGEEGVRGEGVIQKAQKAVTATTSGPWKLVKAFFFGLPNRERELAEEAKAKIDASSETDVSDDRSQRIRELYEEITIQGLLIQGRVREILNLERQLETLKREAVKYPAIEIQSLLVPRLPHVLKYTIENAEDLLGGPDRGRAVLPEHLERETKILNDLSAQIRDLDRQLEAVGERMARKQAEAEREALAQVQTDEQQVELAETAVSLETVDEKGTLESKLQETAARLNRLNGTYKEASSAYDQALVDWYRNDFQDQAVALNIVGEERSRARLQLIKEHKTAETSLKKAAAEAIEVVNDQVRLLDRKQKVLEERFTDMKKPEALRSVYDQELKNIQNLRSSLAQELSSLKSSIN